MSVRFINKRSDRRYHTNRWRKLAKRIVKRDLWRCYVVDCEVAATVADHVVPVTAATTDAEFYDEGGLRAACPGHNLARGFGVDPAPASFFSLTSSARLRRGQIPPHGRWGVIRSDYSRREPTDGDSAA